MKQEVVTFSVCVYLSKSEMCDVCDEFERPYYVELKDCIQLVNALFLQILRNQYKYKNNVTRNR